MGSKYPTRTAQHKNVSSSEYPTHSSDIRDVLSHITLKNILSIAQLADIRQLGSASQISNNHMLPWSELGCYSKPKYQKR